MPKPKNEATKKHGDPMEPLIERTGDSQPGKPGEIADDDREQRPDTDE